MNNSHDVDFRLSVDVLTCDRIRKLSDYGEYRRCLYSIGVNPKDFHLDSDETSRELLAISVLIDGVRTALFVVVAENRDTHRKTRLMLLRARTSIWGFMQCGGVEDMIMAKINELYMDLLSNRIEVASLGVDFYLDEID
ncbi:MAG: hypothetical protein UT33_C0011G0164 [Candidatus Peregrinibacteria bacterium GW2011_GWC2_39_14]|nr:MAG: hypothetical protein UT33_C0011G0164 [Candidatus Peregrinibacteria bacterium GW2011_GWC2_39_14]